MNERDIEYYESQFDPLHTDRRARRKRKPKPNHKPKKDERQIIQEMLDITDVGTEFETTYTPSRFEAGWLMESLQPFFDMGLVGDVLSVVKGGKEASVYRCVALADDTLLAAKVYRPRKLRNQRNYAAYREGRDLLQPMGGIVLERDRRAMRAVRKGSGYGEQLQDVSWLLHEFSTLEALHNAGGAVPQPVASGENAILMSFVGDAYMAAPTLHEIRLEQDEAQSIFDDVLHNIDLMLQHDMIHGDLSAYNILYWEGEITFIDFPQVVNIRSNSAAKSIFWRDMARICDYFTLQGVECDAEAIAAELWDRFVQINALYQAADEWQDEDDEEDDQ